MGKQVVKQPNGEYAVWSSVSDSFVLINATREGVLQFFRSEFLKQLERKMRDVERTIEELDDGEEPYFQFTMSFEECLELMKRNNKEEYDKIVEEVLENG